MIRESIRIAVRGIRANRLRSFLTVLGMLIGVSAVIILVAVGAGSAAANTRQLEALGSNTLTVRAGGFGFGRRGGTQSRATLITDADVTAMGDRTQVPDISQVVPVVNANVTASYQGATATPGQFIGTTANFSAVRNYPVRWGSFFSQADVTDHAKVVVVGTSFVQDLLGIGTDPASLVDAQVKFGPTYLRVIGVFDSKGTNGLLDQDDIAVAPITTVRDTVAGNTGTVSSVTVQAGSASVTDAAQAEVTSLLLSRHRGATSSSYQVLNQASLLQTQDASNQTFTVLLGAVAAISLLVGGIGVMNIMLVSVTERTREIGIRKAIGARGSHILTQFLVEAVLLSVIGGALGVMIGVVGSRFSIVGVQPVVQLYSIALAFGVAVGVGLFFGIYPAQRAATMRPIDALRYE
ncbi:MAG: ABC transporter permease [Actinobacteria bacterium]|nr:ABC transporter permease [Actinomycetota bacterium]